MNDPQSSRTARIIDAAWIVMAVFVAIKAFASPNRHSTYPGYRLTATGWVSSGELPSMNCHQYLPYFGDLMAPFAALPDRIGAPAWALVGFLLYAFGFRRFIADHSPDEQTSATMLAVGLLPGFGSLVNHQANVLVIGCWLLAAVEARRERWWLTAIWLAIPGFKLYTLAMAGVFAVLYPRPLIARLAITISAILMMPFLFHSSDAVIYRLSTMWTYITEGDHYRIFPYQTLFEFWQRYVGSVEAKRFLPIQAFVGISIPVSLSICQRLGHDRNELLRSALFLTSLWCVSFGPSIEPHTYLLAAPALGWGLANAVRNQSVIAIVGISVTIASAGSPIYTLGQAIRLFLSTNKIPFVLVTSMFLIALFNSIPLRFAALSTAFHAPNRWLNQLRPHLFSR
jgi:hypothetical protein